MEIKHFLAKSTTYTLENQTGKEPVKMESDKMSFLAAVRRGASVSAC